MNNPSRFLSSTRARVLTLVFLLQAGAFYGFARKEVVPVTPALATFPKMLNGWTVAQEGVVDKETMDVLRADDVLNRTYSMPDQYPANLFVAYFKTQRTGQVPHSPKNCLPGSGWVPSVSDIIRVPVPGREPIEVNRYIVQKGDQASMVLYWYQSRDRVVASEYKAKYYVVADALRHNRTDTALVRVIVPVVNHDNNGALKQATTFVRDFYPTVRSFLPS